MGDRSRKDRRGTERVSSVRCSPMGEMEAGAVCVQSEKSLSSLIRANMSERMDTRWHTGEAKVQTTRKTGMERGKIWGTPTNKHRERGEGERGREREVGRETQTSAEGCH